MRGDFADDAQPVADLDRAIESIPEQVEAGFTAICFKPSQFTDDPRAVAGLCRRVVERAATLTS